ncbi:hydroxyacylglutathione hydrolase [Pseudogemmobacter blasticus]|uniref:Hydroxyacylglutathione hydrolase n=2 Tax=Fuscovulum blasticum TaxID=1075 RepID=GLO2_FUSBL|nr:hydroxyacylglutathione hydrolase [Fuscovulum blasticum]P05446.1 RecName: Full=Hydroxyacylglutathione hydrolase; AltName: Full=Glyoxalase II; Short=Glx II [Fuscovulum blasticum]PTE13406.1 hydroxyacylglutathione hydrolase [Fuscovulum blasticum DSM 2131]CAA77309.1 URF 3 [Fuscovulum blasticum]
MALNLLTVPCLKDNFAFLLHDAASGRTALVDAPEAAPVLSALAAQGWRLTDILLTHHHDDHIQAVPEIHAATGARVHGAAADAHRLPPLDHALREGDRVAIGAESAVVIDVPGHTRGHIAFHFPGSALAFTGDSLMAAGCGRLFEGTPAEMWASLSKLAALPPETLICSGHDYLDGNLRFALALEPGNPALISRQGRLSEMRREGRLPMPWTLAEELATNPFLRAPLPQMKAAVGLPQASDTVVFAEIRARKDLF